MHVALATPRFDDWDALLALLRRSFAYMDGRIDPPSSLAAMTADDLRAKAAREHLVIARQGDRLVGCAYADVRPGAVYVGKLAVADDVRGRGVARQLLGTVDAIARAHGRDVVELQTRIELVETRQAFAALGFEQTAETSHAGFSRPTSVTMRRTVGAPPPVRTPGRT